MIIQISWLLFLRIPFLEKTLPSSSISGQLNVQKR